MNEFKDEDLISVVLPVFNGERTLQETIESVLGQRHQNLELIVIDDGSTDRTIDILNRVQDPRLKSFSFPNAGLSRSRNRGLKFAQGNYISFIDADDLWAPQKLQKQLTALQQSSDIAAAYSWTAYIDAAGQDICIGVCSTASGNIYERLFLTNFIESGSNILVRRKILEALGGFDESLSAAEDWDCCLQIAQHHPFTVVREIHVFYRQSATSMSADLPRMEQAGLEVIARALQRTPTQLAPLKPLSQANLYLSLVMKALQSPLSRSKGWAAIRFWLISITRCPNLLIQRSKLVSILGIKSLFSLCLPSLYPVLTALLRSK